MLFGKLFVSHSIKIRVCSVAGEAVTAELVKIKGKDYAVFLPIKAPDRCCK